MTTTVIDFVGEKYGRAFDALDADKDGFLTLADYQALGDRIVAAYNLSKEDRRGRALQAFLSMQWMELQRHAGADGDHLNREQYVTGSRLASIDTSRLNLADGHAHAVFDVIDVDEDNEISKDEFVRYLKDVCRATAADGASLFTRIDTDGDGGIARHEFVRTIREYYLSGDPEAPGSLIYGHI